MKKLILLIAGGILSATLPLAADSEMVGGYTWYYRTTGDTAEIYNYGSVAISPDPTGLVTIPATLGGKPVTSLGAGALKSRKWLTGVTIPSGVTKIGASAFSGCSVLKSVTIPSTVTNIGASAFANCSALTGVTIPNGMTSIGASTFKNCSELKSVTIPNSVTYIGDEAFYYCRGLTSVTIPNSVTRIGEGAFCDCSSLTSVTIPNSVTRIGTGAFHNCKKLKSVTIPGSVTYIGASAFSHYFPEGGLTSVTIGYGVARIGASAFQNCRELKSVTIPGSVTYIGASAFSGCDLTSVTVPSSVTYIGAGVFNCFDCKSVILPTWCKNTHVYKSGGEYRLTTETIPGLESSSWQDYLGMAFRGKIVFKDVSGSTGGDVAEIWKKAQTVNGAVFKDGKAVGVIQVKVGKASKNGEVSVSGTITGLDGKKLAAKGGKVGVNGETATATLAVKDGTTAKITMGRDGVSGSWNGAEIKAADVGGNWTRDGAMVYVDAASLPAGTLEALLPDGEPVLAKGGKWAFNKAATVKLSKDRTSAERDTSKGKTNLSGLKLTYTPKTGLFKGSFKVYALEGTDGAKKLKKYTANVTGVVVDGKGFGQASIKKPAAGPWAVTVE